MSTAQPAPPLHRAAFTRFVVTALARPITHWLSGALILLLDALVGSFIEFPILFVFPVIIAARFCDARSATALAIVLPIGRAVIAHFILKPFPLPYILVNAAIRISVFLFIARTTHLRIKLQREVEQLRGILPICMFCKRIRDERQDWQQLESYIHTHSKADFSHGLCPECAQKNYGDVFPNRGHA